MKKYNYLNVGAGNRFHPSWVNLDMVSKSSDVQVADLTKGIPHPDDYFEVVYHAHVLEHIPRESSAFFIKECFRVLKKNGILRVVIPDLEGTAREYLTQLEGAIKGDPIAIKNYELMLLELYDQSVRTQSGGQLKDYLSETEPENKSFILSRMGLEAINTWKAKDKGPLSFGEKVKRFSKWNFRNKWNFLKRNLIKALLFGETKRSYQLGEFRSSGEIHEWMYDRYSLGRLLKEAKFSELKIFSAGESWIPDWNTFNLDMEGDQVVLPNSLYMEAKK